MFTPKMIKTVVFLMILLSVALTVLGIILLPETLVMQITTDGTTGTTMPKLLGLSVPLIIVVIFSILSLKAASAKNLFGAGVGILVYILIFAFNL